MSDKVWQLIDIMIKQDILLFSSVEIGFFFHPDIFTATSVLCLVVVLDTTIIIICLIIQSHTYTS